MKGKHPPPLYEDVRKGHWESWLLPGLDVEKNSHGSAAWERERVGSAVAEVMSSSINIWKNLEYVQEEQIIEFENYASLVKNIFFQIKIVN